ncbi:rhomboid family membrane protein [Aspergillus clavatus NRRL 1]|uniref:Rhomboid-type serine protease n=1 Tax=Aspergillus clavatus (strain ATCC 1007 / CBS 513.65 / DSM 816 / NCTC 3887 / NRRL 1 / QM 1276 / 107) TaxID=344612 RepID=A1C7Y0_ASPCL|nr:DHHC zinc finger membrane protein [Aspergillus clavatus NRRL 1]EAW14501.1 DHHC zinc finger membrane protein [Aspergillus clavatus NRRL 1]
MAAHGYGNNPPTYEQSYPPTDPVDRVSPSPSNAHGYKGPNAHPYTTTDYDPHELRHSQQSIGSDQGAPYVAGGRFNEADQYSDNIPLKANAQYSNGPPPPGWMQQPTRYPPSPEAMEAAGPPGRPVRQKKGFWKKKIAWVTYTLTVAQIIVFIVELVKNAQLTGSPIELHPQFNPMIGPSPYVQINMGARYTPCMKNVDKIQNSPVEFMFPCPNATSTTDFVCSLSELCGFNGVPNPVPKGHLTDRPMPNQWFRFIIPMFLHTGIIHIGFNLLVQMTMGADMERTVGWWRYAFVYLASGIWGFVLGGNYAAQGESSCGCSGSLFGILALYILDLLYTWNERASPLTELIIMVIGIGISFVLGLLPGLDNFSHIGGFVMGLASGLCIMRSPNALRERIGLARNPYVAMTGGAGASTEPENSKIADPGSSITDFFKGRKGPKSAEVTGPLSFFKGRKPLWWAWWLVRLGALVAVLIGFILLIVDFYKYYTSNCSWCYRLSCLPVNDWCQQGEITTINVTTTTGGSSHH